MGHKPITIESFEYQRLGNLLEEMGFFNEPPMFLTNKIYAKLNIKKDLKDYPTITINEKNNELYVILSGYSSFLGRKVTIMKSDGERWVPNKTSGPNESIFDNEIKKVFKDIIGIIDDSMNGATIDKLIKK